MKAWKWFIELIFAANCVVVFAVALIFFWRGFTDKPLASSDVYWAMGILLIEAVTKREATA